MHPRVRINISVVRGRDAPNRVFGCGRTRSSARSHLNSLPAPTLKNGRDAVPRVRIELSVVRGRAAARPYLNCGSKFIIEQPEAMIGSIILGLEITPPRRIVR
jgi:hypothetical protein